MNKCIYLSVITVFFLIGLLIPAFAQEDVEEQQLVVNKLVEEAISNNPSLEAVRREHKAAELRIRPAGAYLRASCA